MEKESRINNKLSNKHILLFVPSFFSYEKIIYNGVIELGGKPHLFEERPIKSTFIRGIAKLFPKFFERKYFNYFKNLVDSVDEDISYILIVKCDCIGTKTLKYFKKRFPKAKMCLYLWDSIKNTKGIKSKIKYFDLASSFDRVDCISNQNLNHRPLFYDSNFENKSYPCKYDLCFCGTIHSDRYSIIKNVKQRCDELSLKFYGFLYLPAVFLFYFYKVFKKGFRRAKKNEFCFKKKTLKDVFEIEGASNVILDIQHNKQSGITMRMIQTAVLANKKVITTNPEIRYCDFYNDKNILVIDRKCPIVPRSFFVEKAVTIDDSIKSRYNITNWLLDVLGI